MINYVSIADFDDIIKSNLSRIPHDIDLIVGIPRSGMLPANLLALYLNKPYTDIDSFLEGHIYGTGSRGEFIVRGSGNKILIVDDSISFGNALKKAQEKLWPICNKYELKYVAIIATEESKNMVDYYCTIIPLPRVFQWNLFHHSIITQSAFDIDGVLCVDPPIDDDGPLYLDYIRNAVPLYIPSVEIHTLVTCRLEKYREATIEWLSKHNVKYKNLIMLNMDSKKERMAWGKHGKYKGDIYSNSSLNLFVESSLAQAKIINKISNKQVFCVENFQMLYPKDNKMGIVNKIKISTAQKIPFLYSLYKKYV